MLLSAAAGTPLAASVLLANASSGGPDLAACGNSRRAACGIVCVVDATVWRRGTWESAECGSSESVESKGEGGNDVPWEPSGEAVQEATQEAD